MSNAESLACMACRLGKRKCIGEKPCARCVAQGAECLLVDGTVAMGSTGGDGGDGIPADMAKMCSTFVMSPRNVDVHDVPGKEECAAPGAVAAAPDGRHQQLSGEPLMTSFRVDRSVPPLETSSDGRAKRDRGDDDDVESVETSTRTLKDAHTLGRAPVAVHAAVSDPGQVGTSAEAVKATLVVGVPSPDLSTSASGSAEDMSPTSTMNEWMQFVNLPLSVPARNAFSIATSIEELENHMRSIDLNAKYQAELFCHYFALLQGRYAAADRALPHDHIEVLSGGRVTKADLDRLEPTEEDMAISSQLSSKLDPELEAAFDLLPVASATERLRYITVDHPDGSQRRIACASIVYMSKSCAELLGVDRELTVDSGISLLALGAPEANLQFADGITALNNSLFRDDGTIKRQRASFTLLWTHRSGMQLKLTTVLDARTTPFYSARLPTQVTYLFEPISS